MNIIVFITQIIFGIVGVLLALMSFVLFFPFRWPAAAMWGLKLVASALSPIFVLAGLFTLMVGVVTGSVFISIIGVYIAMIYLIHFVSVTRSRQGEFEKAFGVDWKTQVKPEQKKYFLSNRTVLKLPAVPEPGFGQDIPFATIPGTDRKLLCDIWQPAFSVKPSGVAFIYMHGSAFYFLDKDFGTRPFFKQLAAQGHVIMDIAYRLAPETDLMGMIHDVKRAIAWMKDNGKQYAVDPDKIIVAGGSAGGYLALMAAYTNNDPKFSPPDLGEQDLRVSSVIALYPATDLEALYYHTNQHLTTRQMAPGLKKKVPAEMPALIKKMIGKDLHRLGMDKDLESIGLTAPMLGGNPDECPEIYLYYSPITHVHPGCPPTLLIQGEHDILVPVRSTQLLYNKLKNENIPAVLHLLPQSDHGFDLVLTNISPAAHNAIYDVERFTSLISNRIDEHHTLTKEKEPVLA